MKAPGLNEVFFATIVFGLNGYFIANVCGNEDYRDTVPIRENIPAREEVSMNSLPQDKDNKENEIGGGIKENINEIDSMFTPQKAATKVAGDELSGISRILFESDRSNLKRNSPIDNREVIPESSAGEFRDADMSGDMSCNNVPGTSKRRKVIRYPGDIDENEVLSPTSARKCISMCKTKIKTQSKIVYKLRAKVLRQTKRISTLKSLILELKKKFGLSDHAKQSIESTFEDDIIRQLRVGRQTNSYNENVKSFALTLNFYSNAAYCYVRRTFGNHLPAPKTIFNWYKRINGHPGISSEGLTILKSRVDEFKILNKKFYVALMADEMSIRTQLIWNESQKKYIGYVDYGLHNEDNDSTEEASDALVFMVVPLNSHGKLPIAYYLTNKLTGEEKANLVQQILSIVHETGAEVLSFTFDGATSNITMSIFLGADIDSKDLKNSFKHPCTEHPIHIFLDICHMLKLIRNNWGSKGIFYDSEGNKIKWDYIVELEKIQKVQGLSLASKITMQHSKYQNNKMKVQLAAQVLSNSVADALQYCRSRYPQFEGCEATITFLKMFNNLFDVLNSKSFKGKGYQHPFHQSNATKFLELFESAEKYIKGLYIMVPTTKDNIITFKRRNIVESDLPKFGERLQNITVPVGRDAVLVCVVDNLQTYKIAWLRVDTQTILTIQNHVITKNHRMTITHAEKRAWILKIRDVKESDMGWYMCQINTDPMKSQVGYLDVVVPPDILDYPTSTDMVVKEGSNVTLKCAATGSPKPTITWRREGGEPITVAGGNEVTSYNGSTFSISRVDRLHMGAYLCIASNGIPPTVSKRVMLIVHFPPMIWIQNQLVGAAIGQSITLDCQSEAFPKSINYWMKNDSIIIPSDKFIPETFENAYKVLMKLTILSVDIADLGLLYKCVAKNSLGDTDGAIKLYHIPHSTVMTTPVPTTTTAMPTATVTQKLNYIVRERGVDNEKSPMHKSSIDVISMSTNNVHVGATSSLWNTDGRERGFVERHGTEVQRDTDMSRENEVSEETHYSSSSSLIAVAVSHLIFRIYLCSLV